mmetsp:Transcript_57018/g.92344  ORF Transcript_57018/g.92344 Transcript_57018/m.92344 type:complete len:88 (-) Transcript_57018:1348-1611(-)
MTAVSVTTHSTTKMIISVGFSLLPPHEILDRKAKLPVKHTIALRLSAQGSWHSNVEGHLLELDLEDIGGLLVGVDTDAHHDVDHAAL